MTKRCSRLLSPMPFALLLPLLLLMACDPSHKDKCEWYLVPEPAQIGLVPEGWVSLCARNYVTNKQKCYLKASLEFSKAVYGKAFRLSRLKIDEDGPFPREVLKINTCSPEDAELRRLEKLRDREPERTRNQGAPMDDEP